MVEAKTAPAEMKVAKTSAPAPAPFWAPGVQMWQSMHDEMERMFDRFTRSLSPASASRRLFDVAPFRHLETSFGVAIPAVDVVETDKDFQIKAELPGLDESNVELTLSGDALTIKGEKTETSEEKGANYHLSERRYGSFQRSFYLPEGTDRDKIAAKFDKGVLLVTLPKTAEAVKQQKKIPIGK